MGLKKNRIIFSIAKKEFYHIIHDPRSLMILFLMPLLQLTMFGYALKMEIEQVKLAIIDYSRSLPSRNLIEYFAGSDFFQPFLYEKELQKVDQLFKNRQAQVVLIIPTDFAEQLQQHTLTPLQVLVDGADPNAATIIRQYMNQIIINFNQDHSPSVSFPFDIESTLLYNPDKKSTYFFVPALIALLLVMISALLTSIAITREKENGTMEQILVSPVRPFQIIVGKVVPYIALAFSIGLVILLTGVFLFKVPFRGSIILLLLLSTLYIITALSLGLMISAVARTQQVAMMVALIATLLPTLLLSGFIFPIASMPRLLQYFTYLVPAKYYLFIVRGIILKGSTLYHLLFPTLFLFLMSGFLLVISIRKFSLTLEK